MPPPEPAHVIARRRLAALRAADLSAAGKIKEYYSELSFCLREYLENRYHLPALEMTSGEILQSPVQAGLPLTQQAALAEVLNLSDLVKFAKHRPAEETAIAHFSLVGYCRGDQGGTAGGRGGPAGRRGNPAGKRNPGYRGRQSEDKRWEVNNSKVNEAEITVQM